MVREALSGSSFYGTPLYWWLQTPKQVCGLCNQRYRLCGYYKKPWKCFQSLPFPKLVAGLPWLSSRFANCFQWLCVPLSSSEWSMSGFRPRPGRVFSPLMPSTSKRFNHGWPRCVSFPFAHRPLWRSSLGISIGGHGNAYDMHGSCRGESPLPITGYLI